MTEPLTNEQIAIALEKLDGWAYEDGRLHKTFILSSFRAAISFIVRLAFSAESLNHHPHLVNVYNRVEVTLTTHDADNRVTERDVLLAQEIERFAWS